VADREAYLVATRGFGIARVVVERETKKSWMLKYDGEGFLRAPINEGVYRKVFQVSQRVPKKYGNLFFSLDEAAARIAELMEGALRIAEEKAALLRDELAILPAVIDEYRRKEPE